MKMEQTECSETSAYKIQTSGNYLEESIQHSEHGESLKSRIKLFASYVYILVLQSDHRSEEIMRLEQRWLQLFYLVS